MTNQKMGRITDYPGVSEGTTTAPLLYPNAGEHYMCLINSHGPQIVSARPQISGLTLPSSTPSIDDIYFMAGAYKSLNLETRTDIRNALMEQLVKGLRIEVEAKKIEESLQVTETFLNKGGKSLYQFQQKYQSAVQQLSNDDKAKYAKSLEQVKLAFAKKAAADANLKSLKMLDRIETQQYSVMIAKSAEEFQQLTKELNTTTIELNTKIGLPGPLTYGQVKRTTDFLSGVQKVFDELDKYSTRIEIGYHTYTLATAKSDEEKLSAIDGLISLGAGTVMDAAATKAATLLIAIGTGPAIAAGVGVYVIYIYFEEDIKSAIDRGIANTEIAEKLLSEKRAMDRRGQENLRELEKLLSPNFEKELLRYLFSR